MPELPEVETIRRGLEKNVIGSVIVEAHVSGKRTVRRQSIRSFESLVRGRRMLAAERRGKYLLVALDVGTLVVHLRMSGQLCLLEDASDPPVPHTHARFCLDDGRELRFVDPRTFGELFVAGPGGVDLESALSGVGRDPLVDGLDAAWIEDQASRRRTSLKAFLLDQRRIAGIGNIYADEICFDAGIRPARPAGSLSPDEYRALAASIAKVLGRAIEDGGSSLKDERYRDLLGELGRFQQRIDVYGRENEPCHRCGAPVARLRLAGRSAHFCPNCQR
jgi:formamidopyrimidine-DNA glycosylase